ncbi:MAG: hypothetical protein WBH91_05255, partial [Bacteroidales bacterium]
MKKRIPLLLVFLCLAISLPAQNRSFYPLSDSTTAKKLTDSLQSILADGVMRAAPIHIRSIHANEQKQLLSFKFTNGMADYPIREEKIQQVKQAIRHFLPDAFKPYELQLRTDGKDLEELIPDLYKASYIPLTRSQIEKNKKDHAAAVAIDKKKLSKRAAKVGTPQEVALQQKLENRQAAINALKIQAQEQQKRDLRKRNRHKWPDLGPTPLVTREEQPFTITNGLQNSHIALWHSHGLYYEQKQARWQWQRARLFQTVEDLYTMSYVIPFLVPMLENAGARVLLPRERDTQIHEVIVDNDSPWSGYSEQSGTYIWRTDEKDTRGFAHKKDVYTHYDNPFRMGTYRRITTHNPDLSKKAIMQPAYAQWIPTIPQAGAYAVYVSYVSLPESARDARYTVHHKGGTDVFRVNQQMGGGTWIYLGTFLFDEGRNMEGRVTLTNESREINAVVTADAVKFGGGMGNIGRFVQDTAVLASYGNIEIPPVTSQYPRFTEGSRYWLQWAGFADSVYTYNEGENDYNDDFSSRGRWVNALAGGSEKYPQNPGLHIPIDLSLAFHTDAGVTYNDSIIGTLAIYTRDSDGTEMLPTGQTRLTSRDLTDIIQTQIVNDIRQTWNPDWTRRGIWNRSYAESRSAQVPAMLLELLSHQNFADMRFGLDPRFRFTASRAIYKGMLRYLSHSKGIPYIVQPLPVGTLSVDFMHPGKALLTWTPTEDVLEPSAVPDGYMVYIRKGDTNQAFDKGRYVRENSLEIPVEPGIHYSIKVTAVNKGGESFPSETVSLYQALQEKGKILIVNGFTRVSGPDSFASEDTLFAGFHDPLDYGIPYISDISYTGPQFEFRRKRPWAHDDAPGFGASHADWEKTVLPGNTFDYAYIHGIGFAQNGYSYVTYSLEAFTKKEVNAYAVDLILGNQKKVLHAGMAKEQADFAVFPPSLQNALIRYTHQGGNVLITGSHITTDLWDGPLADTLAQRFAQETLKIRHRTNRAAKNGEVMEAPNPFPAFYKKDMQDKIAYTFYAAPNLVVYPCIAPDAFEPAVEGAYTVFRYAENRLSAGVAWKGDYKIVTLGFPLETLRTPEERQRLIT